MTDYAKGRADALLKVLEAARRIQAWHGGTGAVSPVIVELWEAIDAYDALAQQPQPVKEIVGYDRNNQPVFGVKPQPERRCDTCNSWTGSHCVDLEFPIRDCINDSYSEWQPKGGA